MNGERPYRNGTTGALVSRRQQLFQTLEIPAGDERDRRPRAGEERRENRWILERQHIAKLRHERSTRPLMPPIPHRFAQQVVVAGLQRMHQRQHPLHIEHGIPSRQRIGQRRPCFRGRKTNRRSGDNEAKVLGPVPSQARPARHPRARSPTSARRAGPRPHCPHGFRAKLRPPEARLRAAAA